MIALLQIALQPYELLTVPGQELTALRYSGDVAIEGIEVSNVLVLPPYRSRLSERDAAQMDFDAELFNPADPQPVDANVTVDGVAAVRCDAIAVNIVTAEFDRGIEGSQEAVQALLTVGCAAVNGLLERLRVMARATHIKPLPPPDKLLFRLVLMDDSGTPIAKEEGKWKQIHSSGSLLLAYTAVTPAIWSELVDLGEYEIPPWDELLLDALGLDAELGPSLVLAATAVETRVATALDVLAIDNVNPDLWAWINDRDDDYRKTPSIEEQLGELLRIFGGRSLKDEARLWDASIDLRRARNSFVHRGRPVLGKKIRTPVTREKARELVAQAGEIIDFIEALLPEDHRRPRIQAQSPVSVTMPLIVRPPEGVDPATPEAGQDQDA
jgi:hypothetical protein